MLVCLAHPDDETFGMGGTLALYSRRGELYLVCATEVSVGDVDPALLKGFSSIAERRDRSSRCAAQILDIKGVYFLGYRDSGMPGTPDNQHPNALAFQPTADVAAKVAQYIRQIRPQVVVTHDPIGGYKHPDHIAMHKATVMALDLAADPNFASDLPTHRPDKVYFVTLPKGMLRWAVRVAPLLGMDPRKFGRNKDINLVDVVKEGNFPTHAYINCNSVLEIRDEATACHASQLGGSIARKGPMALIRRYLGKTETFTRAYPPPENHLRETDLFAGVEKNVQGYMVNVER
jgi:LmbE family N-acetylglucosaminyl deacetylase